MIAMRTKISMSAIPSNHDNPLWQREVTTKAPSIRMRGAEARTPSWPEPSSRAQRRRHLRQSRRSARRNVRLPIENARSICVRSSLEQNTSAGTPTTRGLPPREPRIRARLKIQCMDTGLHSALRSPTKEFRKIDANYYFKTC
jgi:hypothetical protein